MMGEVCVHQDDMRASARGQSLDIRRAQAQLARSRMQLQLLAVDFLQLGHDLLSAIGRVIVNNDHLHVDVVLLRRLKQ